jgi:hypothetical protein
MGIVSGEILFVIMLITVLSDIEMAPTLTAMDMDRTRVIAPKTIAIGKTGIRLDITLRVEL